MSVLRRPVDERIVRHERADVRAYRYSDDRAADRPSVDRADRLACADEPFV